MKLMTIDSNRRQIAGWLIICALVIYGMIVLGGVTRLTGSGLSMVEWKPLMGVIPPLTDAQWQDTFEKYQQFPEYQNVNYNMDLAGFKKIFVFEYAHRVLGRTVGVIFFIPFLFFLFRGRVNKTLAPKLWALFVLGGLQGLMGWYMVKSGLVDIPRVSQYRLTAHLGLAVLIYSYMLWVVFDLLLLKPVLAKPDASSVFENSVPALKTFALVLSGLIFLMILSGGLVAGLDAGFAYNTFPLMDGQFFPAGLYNLSPPWLSAFADITTVQFNHRIFAYLITLLVIIFASLALLKRVTGALRFGIYALLGCLVVQLSLGIATLLYVVPVPLAAAHQAGAIALLTASLFVSHRMMNHTGPSPGLNIES